MVDQQVNQMKAMSDSNIGMKHPIGRGIRLTIPQGARRKRSSFMTHTVTPLVDRGGGQGYG